MAFAGTVIGRGIIPVSLDPSGIGGQVAGLQGAMAGRFGAIGKVAGGAFAIGAGAAIGGKVLFDLGAEFDDAFDTIRVGTGLTGKSLIGLQKDFKEVARNGPDSFDLVGTAITDLNRRLDLSGKPLRTLARQMLDLSRITKTDLSTNVESLTRVFGDWNIKGTDMTSALDELFRASQATGAPVDRLATAMTKFGSPLRQLGFDFATTAALIGKFEKEGVNTELVLGSMRIAVGRLSKEGVPAVDMAKTLAKRMDDIRTSANPAATAAELFGQRAGPDMAAAIVEGRLSVRDLLKEIRDGKETITTATKDTSDFAEAWGTLKNELKVAAEPAATGTFTGLSTALKWMNETGTPAIGGFLQKLKNFNQETDRILSGRPAGANPLSLHEVGGALDRLKSKSKKTWVSIKADSVSTWSVTVGTAKSKGSELIGYIGTLPGRIGAVFGGIGSLLSSAGSELIGGLLGGIQSRFKDVQSTLADLTSKLPSWKGPMEVDQSILFDSGVAVMGGFVRGIESERDAVRRSLSHVTASLPRDVTAPTVARNGSTDRPIRMNDGTLFGWIREIANGEAELVVNDQLTFAGTMGRMNR